jgi:hypothetical protein
MIYTLVRLFKEGVPIPTEELSETKRYAGNPVIEDWIQGGPFQASSPAGSLVEHGVWRHQECVSASFCPYLNQSLSKRLRRE